MNAAALGGLMYVDGKWVPAEGGMQYPVVDPGRGEAFANAADASISDAISAIDAAATASASWAATPPRERGEILRRAFDLMVGHRDELAALIARENGKAWSEAVGEVNYAAEFLRWFSEEACRIDGRVAIAPNGGYRILTQYEPVGISVCVTPWNFPAAMATRKLGPALAAGCTTVLKPAKETPLTALALAELFAQAGIPAGVVNVVTTSTSAPVVAAMLSDPRVRKLSFTGSTEVGQLLLEQAAKNVLRTSMELGGNAPFLVLEDADLEVAVQSAMVAKLRNGGQSCTAANRFYVHNSRLREFTELLASAMARVRVGYALDPLNEVGAMINDEARSAVLELIADAEAAGAKVVQGGHAIAGGGYFLEPTVLRDVPPDCRCMAEEIFGPVAPVTGFDDVDEAVAQANATGFGLVAFVQSRDLRAALSVADALQVGMVGINRGVVSDPAAPFGGWKKSGLGREGAHEGILEYLETKYIAASW